MIFFTDDPDYEKTDRVVHKQVLRLKTSAYAGRYEDILTRYSDPDQFHSGYP